MSRHTAASDSSSSSASSLASRKTSASQSLPDKRRTSTATNAQAIDVHNYNEAELPKTPPISSQRGVSDQSAREGAQRRCQPGRAPRIMSAETVTLNERLLDAIGSTIWDFEKLGGLGVQSGGLELPARIIRRAGKPFFPSDGDSNQHDRGDSEEGKEDQDFQSLRCTSRKSASLSPEDESDLDSRPSRRQSSNESLQLRPPSSLGSLASPALTMASTVDDTDAHSPVDVRVRSDSNSSKDSISSSEGIYGQHLHLDGGWARLREQDIPEERDFTKPE